VEGSADAGLAEALGGLDPETETALKLTHDSLTRTVHEWPLSAATRPEVAEQLRVSRELFVHSLLVYVFAAVGAGWSLLAVESALRWALDASENVRFFNLIERARDSGLVDAEQAKLIHMGRRLRNSFSHPTSQPVWTRGMAAAVLRGSHAAVKTISEGSSPSRETGPR
jgi:hypothetical protein